METAEIGALMAEVLARQARFQFQARGFSMYPFICDGDVITLAPPPARIQIGQVVAFIGASQNRLLVHRIVAASPRGILTRGDNSLQADGLIAREQILGWVVRVDRGDRQVKLGLGLERIIIAFFSKPGWLVPLRNRFSQLKHILTSKPKID